MIKNFIENAKQTAQKVIHKEQKVQLEQMPTFESLAQKNYTVLQKEIWQYTQEDMNRVIQQMEDYIQRVQKAYNEVSESFNPLFIKFDMLEKERKRMAAELQESEKIKKELETAMVEMQQDFDNELRKKELMVFELDQTKKEIQALQSKVDWNNIDDTDNDFGKVLLELDKSQDEQYKKRIETLTQEVLDQIQLNKDQITKIQNLQNELDKQYQENRNLNRNLNMVLQQLADVQTKSRQEIESKNQQINSLQNEMGKLNKQLNECTQQQSMTMDLQMENEKLKEQIADNDNKLKIHLQQLQKFVDKNKENQKLLDEYFELVKQLNQKRDNAILELNRLTSKQVIPGKVDRLKQIRYDLQAKLIKLRQEFEQIYKQFMQTISQMDDNAHSQKLMQLENKLNSQIMIIQNVIDEVEDLT